MKKIISLLAVLCMLFALCACGAETAEETTAAETAAQAAETVEAATEAAVPAEAAGETVGEATAEADKPGNNASTPEEPIAAEDQPVAGHAEAVDVTLDEGASYLAFTGDQHGETAGYRVWLEDQLAVYGDSLSLLNYSGDVCEKNWEQATFDTWKAVLDELVPGRYNVTTGNQEWKSGAPGATWADLGEGFLVNGEVVSTDDYAIYNIGATSETMLFPQEELDAISAYLAAAPADKPIFVLSHFPLHLSVATADHSIPGGDHRQSENNGALIEILNNYPNVIFLWGHNHTFQDPRYGTICPAGSKMTWDYNNPTEKIELNFTYVNYGSFCRGDSYGLIAEVLRDDAGVNVYLNYVDTNVPMETKDSALITVAADGTVSSTVTAGTGIDYDEILSMSGYAEDASFMDELRG